MALKKHRATNTKELEVTKEAAAHLTSVSQGSAVTARHPQAASSVFSDRLQINSTSVCCWDRSYSGQWCLSCLHSPPSPVHILPQLTQTNSMANLIEAEQKQLFPSVILTVPSPAWHLVNQVEIELYRWIELSRESCPGGKKSRLLWLHISLGRTGCPLLFFYKTVLSFYKCHFGKTVLRWHTTGVDHGCAEGVLVAVPPRPVCLRAPELQCLSVRKFEEPLCV